MKPFQKALLLMVALLLISTGANAAFRPQVGHWVVPNEQGPGSGINLTTQGNILGISIFTYDDNGNPIWYIAASELSPLEYQFGFVPKVIFEAELLTAMGGAPIQNTFSSGQIISTGRNLRLEFSSTTTALMTLDGVTKPIRTLAFGRDLLRMPSLDLPAFTGVFPDITGRWVLFNRVPGIAGPGLIRPIVFRPAEEEDPRVAGTDIVFFNDQAVLPEVDVRFFCRNQSGAINVPGTFASCSLQYSDSSSFQFLLPQPNSITHERFDVLFETRLSPPEQRFEVFALRIPDEVDIQPPQSGHWQLVGEQGVGSGVNITINGNLMGVSIFTYDEEGRAVWLIASGAFDIEQRTFQAPLQIASNGVPIMDEFSPAELTDSGMNIAIEFDRVGQAQLTIDGQSKIIRPLLFAIPEVSVAADVNNPSALTFPDIEGDWVLVLEFNDDQPMITEPITFLRTGTETDIQYDYEFPSGTISESSITCAENDSVPVCQLAFELVRSDETTNYGFELINESVGLNQLTANVNNPIDGASASIFRRVFLLRTR